MGLVSDIFAARIGRRRTVVARSSVVAEALRGQADPRERAATTTALPAVVEPLEHRIHLSATFDCYVSGPATIPTGTPCALLLWTTGGTASKFVVNWNDSNGTKSATYYPSKTGVPYGLSYSYVGTCTAPITVVATSTTGAIATGYYGLGGSYGDFQAQNTGATVYNNQANRGGVGQTSMAVDNFSSDPMYKTTFVAHPYYETTGGHPLIGISAFDSNGRSITTWGSINNNMDPNNGTMVVDPFGGGSDVPYAMAIGRDGENGDIQLIIVGKCATGWAMCAVETGVNPNILGGGNYGYTAWVSTSSFEPGQANAVTIDTTDSTHFVAVGTDGTHMVAASIYMEPSGFSPQTGWGSLGNGIEVVPLDSDASQMGANAVFEEDDGGFGKETLIAGGYTYWSHSSCGCGTTTGSDFTLVPIDDYYGTAGTDKRTNVGETLLASGACTSCVPSNDSVYSLVPWTNPSGSMFVDAIGQSNAESPAVVTIAQYALDANGDPASLVSGFGTKGSGIALGPTGNAFAATIVNPTAGTFVVVGTAAVGSTNDILTCQFTSTGSLDTSFGNGGTMYQGFGTNNGTSSTNSQDSGYAVGFAVDGSLLVCGSTLASGASFSQIALIDYLDSNQLVVT